MTDKLKIRIGQDVPNVVLAADKKIVQANDIISVRQQPVAKMGAEKTCSAGY